MRTNDHGGKFQVTFKGVILGIVLVFLAVVFLFPIVWIMTSSFKPPGELFSWPPTLFGSNPTFENYILAFAAGNFPIYFRNTLYVTLMATFLTIVVNVMAGYVFAKYKFRFQNLLFAMVLTTLMVPLEVVMVPIFRVLRTVGMIDSLWGLIIPAIASPTAVFLVRQYYILWNLRELTEPVKWEFSCDVVYIHDSCNYCVPFVAKVYYWRNNRWWCKRVK